MSLIKRNIIANFSGNIWTGIMNLVFVPLYIRFMGIEAYGLVGIFACLQALFALLDIGLSSTLNREMANLSVQQNKAREMRDLLRTLEIPYWIVAIVIAGSVILASPLIAYHWVNAVELEPHTVRRAVSIMGLAVGFRWPLSFYSGGLMGLQRQVLLNTINAVMATCRGLGAVIILWLISPTIEAFFSWQILVSSVHVGFVLYYLWRSLSLGTPHRPRFRYVVLRHIWKFAVGMTGITALTTILTQLDKIILSRMLSLQMFGYYTLATVVAMNLYRLISPVMSATYPRLTNLFALGAMSELADLYHKSAQLVSIFTLPTTMMLVFFSKEILLLWTQDSVVAEHAHLIVSILILGTALNGLMNIPYALQLASGWTKLAFSVNLVSILFLIPLMILMTYQYGPTGAASVWVILNAGYVLFAIQFMHKRLLPAEKWRWYVDDVGKPVTASLFVVGLFRAFAPCPDDMFLLFLYLAVVFGVALVTTVLATSLFRPWVQAKLLLLLPKDELGH